MNPGHRRSSHDAPRTALRSAAFAAAIFIFCGAFAEAAVAGSDPYRVGPGDTLSITAYGDAGLTGQFVVGPDGTIGFPLLGNLDVTNLTTAEIDDAINRALGQYVTERRVTVTVSAYAPVYILGDVDQPGRYDFHPGMISLELVAMSGGDRRGKDAVDGAQIQLVVTRQEYSDLALQIFSNQVRRARLQAEMDDEDFTYPLGNETDPSEREIRQRIIGAEAKVFEIRRANLVAQKTGFENQRRSYTEEINALEERYKLHDDEIGLLEQDVGATKSLVERGLTAKSNLREIERQLSAARRDSLEMGSFLARARQGELDIAQRIDVLTETVRSEAANGIREIDLDTVRKQKQMASLLDRMAAISSAADALRARELRAKLVYVVVRPTEDGFEEIKADDLTELKPRDILRATLTLPDDSAGATVAGSVN
jgi:polysaccharide export outer membrane protein